MAKRCFAAFLVFALSLALNGCATFGKKKDLEIQELKNQVLALEAQVQNKDREINTLKYEIERVDQEGKNLRQEQKIIEPKSRPNIKQIQMALRNAGYNPGKIDGKMGKQTREAIKSFQAANNLPVDGVAGKRTWEALRQYFSRKVK